jgi:hypothetical protein
MTGGRFEAAQEIERSRQVALAMHARHACIMNAIRGAALVYLSASTRERADAAVFFTRDFLDAAHARAAELRREEMARLAGVAWGFVMRLVKRTIALWKNERLMFREKPRTDTIVAGLFSICRR